MFSFGMVSVILLLYLNAVGIKEELGVLLSGIVFGDVFITFFLTTRADRFGRKKTLIVGTVLKLFAGIMFALCKPNMKLYSRQKAKLIHFEFFFWSQQLPISGSSSWRERSVWYHLVEEKLVHFWPRSKPPSSSSSQSPRKKSKHLSSLPSTTWLDTWQPHWAE